MIQENDEDSRPQLNNVPVSTNIQVYSVPLSVSSTKTKKSPPDPKQPELSSSLKGAPFKKYKPLNVFKNGPRRNGRIGEKEEEESQPLRPVRPHEVNKLKASVEARINRVQVINPLGPGKSANIKAKPILRYLPGGVPVHANELDTNGEKEAESVKSSVKTDLIDEKSAEYAGFHCSVCNSTLKSFHAYLDHINGKKHLKALGYSTKISEYVTVDQVKDQLSQLQEQKHSHQNIKTTEEIQSDYEKKWADEAEKERLLKEEKKKSKKLEKQSEADKKKESLVKDDAHFADDHMLEAMKAAGFDFSSFSTSKK